MRCCGRSIPKRISGRPTNGSGCSSSSTGAARRPTPTQRGHPRLRMRHAPFEVTLEARDRWLVHFREGLDKAALPPELDEQFWDYVQHAAQFMVNSAR